MTDLQDQLGAINTAFRESNGNEDTFAAKIDEMLETGFLEPGEIEGLIEQKATDPSKHDSKLNVRSTKVDHATYNGVYSYLRTMTSRVKDIPDFENPYVDYYLADIWKMEPILAGAVYSMAAKMTAIAWSVTGKTLAAKRAATLLASAAYMGGYDWAGFVSATAQDFYTTNRGVFWETPRRGHYMMGALSDLGHIDALSCSLTGNTKHPVYYESELTGQQIKFRPGETIHFASMPSARERHLGTGFCAVARSIRAAKLLMGLHDYDAEKLDNLPPEGVAAVTGLTVDEFQDALAMWKFEREKNNSLTFPQVLWLIGSQPSNQVKLDFVGFSQMPESFERKIVVDQYVNLIALVFGVDAREFWPISTSTLGTAAESEIQHLKAKGKGPGEFISITERHINGELSDDADFAFDTQDIEEDLKSAEVATAWISAYMPLLGGGAQQQPAAPQNGNPQAPPPSQPQQEGLLKRDQVLRLLVDKGVLPDYLLNDGKTAIMDSDVRIKEQTRYLHADDLVKITWSKDGRLTRERVYLGEMYTGVPQIQKSVSSAPNYREVDPTAQKRCTNCAHSEGMYCNLYDFFFERRHVCDSWESNGRMKEFSDPDVEEARNIIGNPIPDHEALAGARATRTSVEDENALWRNTPGLSRYALSEDEASDYEVS